MLRPALFFALTTGVWCQTLVVGHKWANSVGFYDSNTGKMLQTVGVGERPQEMAFSTDRRLIYVVNSGVRPRTPESQVPGSISIIDREARKEVGRIELGKYFRPHGIETGPRTGRLYVTADSPPSLLVVDPNGQAVEERIEIAQKTPYMVALTADETRAYVTNPGSGSVTTIPLDDRNKPVHIEVGGEPMGLVVEHKRGRYVWVATGKGGQLVAIDLAKQTVAQRIEVAGQPVRVWLTPDDRFLLVTTIESGEIVVIDPGTFKEVRRIKVGSKAQGMHFDEVQGFLYVSAQGDNKVVKYRSNDWTPVLEFKTGARPDPILQFD